MIPIKHPCQISYPIFPPPKNTKRGRCQTGAWRRTSNLFSAVWGISCLHRCAKFGPPQLGTPKFGKFWNHFGEYLLASTSIYLDFGFVQWDIYLRRSCRHQSRLPPWPQRPQQVPPRREDGPRNMGKMEKFHSETYRKVMGTIHEWYMRNEGTLFSGLSLLMEVFGTEIQWNPYRSNGNIEEIRVMMLERCGCCGWDPQLVAEMPVAGRKFFCSNMLDPLSAGHQLYRTHEEIFL